MLLARNVDDIPARFVRDERDALRAAAFERAFGAPHDASVPITSHFEHEIEPVFENRNNDGSFRGQPHIPAMFLLAPKRGDRLERGRSACENTIAVGCWRSD